MLFYINIKIDEQNYSNYLEENAAFANSAAAFAVGIHAQLLSADAVESPSEH